MFPHSDLYALAATVLVLLTGKEPPELIDPKTLPGTGRDRVRLSPQLGSILDSNAPISPRRSLPVGAGGLTSHPNHIFGYATPNLLKHLLCPYNPRPKDRLPFSSCYRCCRAPSPVLPQFSHYRRHLGAGLLSIFGKTSALLLAIAGAIGLGWG